MQVSVHQKIRRESSYDVTDTLVVLYPAIPVPELAVDRVLWRGLIRCTTVVHATDDDDDS